MLTDLAFLLSGGIHETYFTRLAFGSSLFGSDKLIERYKSRYKETYGRSNYKGYIAYKTDLLEIVRYAILNDNLVISAEINVR
jgi:hypothetical protein